MLFYSSARPARRVAGHRASSVILPLAHRLFPITPDAYLEPADIVRRLRAEFDHVEADADEGTSHILGMMEQFRRMNFPQAVIDAHRDMLGKAISITVADRPDFDNDYVRFTAMPATAPLVGYSGAAHEAAAGPLLRRVCGILRYTAELV